MQGFADSRLARLLEGLAAAEMRRFAETASAIDPDLGATWIEVAGGVATYVGADSPVNRAMGLGMGEDPVSVDEITRLEEFYGERGAEACAGICPLAHPSLLSSLAQRSWIVSGFENVLVRDVSQDDAHTVAGPGIEIREAEGQEDRELWGLVAATGFSDPLPPLQQQLALARVVIQRPGTRLFLAFADGKVAGTGEMLIEKGVAWLSADATLPQFRGRGVQQALQRRRICAAAQAGCRLAATESTPGSPSQRNMERLGFRIVYTRVDMSRPVKQ